MRAQAQERTERIMNGCSVDAPERHMPPAWLLMATLTLVWAAALAIRLNASPDIMSKDQERPAAFVMDAAQNGHWLCQTDHHGNVMRKPPLFTWLSAAATAAFGRINAFTLSFGSWLSTLLTVWLVMAAGCAFMGRGAGFWAGMAYLLSITGLRMITLARTDTIFALTTFAMAMAGWRAWNRGRGWTLFWLCAAVATLSKGPLGPLLAWGGLAAAAWEKRSGRPLPLRGSHWLGLALFVVICAGWLFLAYLQLGDELVRKLIVKELLGHAKESGSGNFPGEKFYQPPFYFLSQFLPWSLLTVRALWRVVKRPAADETERRFERFLFCYFVIGLAIFSLAPHQRQDLLFPLLPAAALLAGREAKAIFRPKGLARDFSLLGAALAALAVAAWAYYGPWEGRQKDMMRSRHMRDFAQVIESRVGPGFPLTHTGYVDSQYGLQFYLNTLRRTISQERAAEALAGEAPVFVVTDQWDALVKAAKTRPGTQVYEVESHADWGEQRVSIASNYPLLRNLPRGGAVFPPVWLEWQGARMTSATENSAAFWAVEKSWRVLVRNESEATVGFSVAIGNGDPATRLRRDLAPKETWMLEGAGADPNAPPPARPRWRWAWGLAFMAAVAAALAPVAARVTRMAAAARRW